MDNAVANEKDIYEEIQQPLIEGEKWYLVNNKWFESWKKYIGVECDEGGGEPPGPIDNSSLFIEGSEKLKDHLLEESDYDLVPEESWTRLVQAHGLEEGQKPIGRKVIESGTFTKQTNVEIYPPEISFHEHGKDSEVKKELFSRAETMENVHKKVREIFEVQANRTTRLYVKDSDTVTESDTLDKAGVGPTTILILEYQNSDGTWQHVSPSLPSYDQAMSSSSSTNVKKFTSPPSYSNSYNGYSTRSNYGYYSSRSEKPGLCGLSNLGNTCFMNSAIQCLSNVPYLNKYFLEKKYEDELNPTNPLGMHGKLAKAYAALVHDIWSGQHSSVSPRDFKYNVGSFAPQFSGYQQHDSQELLAFLIDGLHEDLNRIKQKPYIELQDSGGRQDKIVATEAWQNHLQRNDSIIVDTFHGLFKSTLVCPDCNRISITFDPFGFLSLPLPTKKEIAVICNFVRKDSEKYIEKHSVSVPKNGRMGDVLESLGERVGCDPKSLVIADVYNFRFYKVYRKTDKVSSYSDRDNLFVYELDPPTDEKSEPEYARVLMRISGRIGPKLFAHPFMIPVKSGETTYRKFYNSVLAAVSRYLKEENRDDIKMLSELKNFEIKETDVDEIQENADALQEQENDENAKEQTRLFRLVSINSFGTTIFKELEDNEKPITNFARDIYFAADWDSELYNDYVLDDWLSTFEDDPSFSVAPKKEKGISLDDCMSLFTTEEKLGEHDLWYCPGCKEHKQATKKFDLWALPPVLIIHLKRFSYSRWSRDKIGTMVDFPIRDLDLSRFIINPDKKSWPKEKKRYNLIGVSNHYGGLGGGHYTAYARNYMDNKWYYFDDSSVSESSEDKVQTKAAYMLMYQRQDMEEWVKRSKEGEVEKFSFLESMVSPRGYSGTTGFTYDGLKSENSLEKTGKLNGNGNLSEGDYNNGEMMDTS